MPNTKRYRRANMNGSPNAKIVNVNEQQGFGNIGKQQGTSRIIYDAVKINTSTTKQTLSLFQDAKSHTTFMTNLTENKLQYKESTSMQQFSFYIIETIANDPDQPLAIVPLDYFAQFKRLYTSQFDFFIANARVIKQFPLASLYAPFNKDSSFMGIYQTHPDGGDLTTFTIPNDVFNFYNDLIIPPTIEFRCDITIPPVTNPSGFDFYLAMKLEGLGSLYAPKSNY